MPNPEVPLIHRVISKLRRFLWLLINPIQYQRFMKKDMLRLHLGCSEHRLEGFINVDIRYTWATDVTIDLNNLDLKEGQVLCVYSNAFFEHLLRGKRIEHLKTINNALNKQGGVICYTGMPYFKNIARFYLDGERGMHNEPVLDLYNVYRYTHGDPERMENLGWYHEQLHKSLFDEEELGCLLDNAGFESYTIFEYAFPDDPNPLRVNIGFYATKEPRPIDDLQKECTVFLASFPQYVKLNSVKFLLPSEQKKLYYRV